jgi:hypothetical protein
MTWLQGHADVEVPAGLEMANERVDSKGVKGAGFIALSGILRPTLCLGLSGGIRGMRGSSLIQARPMRTWPDHRHARAYRTTPSFEPPIL